MHRIAIPLLLTALAAAAPLSAQARIDTLRPGTFSCELPGDAAGPAGISQEAEDFSIVSSSRYTTVQGGGTYLLSRSRLEMTSGPRKGDAYRVESRNYLRKLDDTGNETRLRCVRSGS